jgi:hypothetical protein
MLCDNGKVRNYRAHGFRKAALIGLAHAKATLPELMAAGGHASPEELLKKRSSWKRWPTARWTGSSRPQSEQRSYKPFGLDLQTRSQVFEIVCMWFTSRRRPTLIGATQVHATLGGKHECARSALCFA